MKLEFVKIILNMVCTTYAYRKSGETYQDDILKDGIKVFVMY